MKIPTLAEVQAFFVENEFYNAVEEAEKCYYHYESTKVKGRWVRGSMRNRIYITNWKAVCHNWNRNAISYAKANGTYIVARPAIKQVPVDNKERVFMPANLFTK